MTFPMNEQQGPATQPEEYPGVEGVAHYDEGIFVGYRWYDEHKHCGFTHSRHDQLEYGDHEL